MIEYKNLLSISKIYSFYEKMKILNIYSSSIINIKKNIIELSEDKVLPWELEIVYIFFVVAKEWKMDDFNGKNEKKFLEIIECIRNYDNPKINNLDLNDIVKNMFTIYCFNQFEIQEVITYKLYRYNYFFNFKNKNIDMSNEFIKKFNYCYQYYINFMIIILFLFGSKHKFSDKIFDYTIMKYKNIVRKLSISREKCINRINFFAQNIYDYYSCVKPCNIYPFLKEDGKYYLPLPHCIIAACTNSLLYRITDNNNEIRSLFGKEVLEQYLFDILSESNIFDEVIGEKNYIYKRQQMRTSDVMCRKEDFYVFFESKSMVPNAFTRCIDEESIIKETDKIIKAMNQVYNQLINKFEKEYYFFKFNGGNININKCFGIVCMLGDPFISRKDIYRAYANKYHIDENSEIYDFIINHIKICSLYDLERYAFTQNDILKSLIRQLEEQKPYDYVFADTLEKNRMTANIIKFKEEQKLFLINYFEELKQNKIIT